MKRLFCIIFFALGFGAISAPPAHALACAAIVGCSCTVHATTMNFGNTISPLSGNAVTAQADITVNCTNVVDVLPAVLAQIGGGTYGTTGDRVMKSTTTADTLHYNIYRTNNYTTILGIGGATGYPALTISGGVLSLGGWTATETVHGRLTLPANTRPQTFTDTVTVRIDW
jgi:spore coat protein U-like protein